MQPSAEFRSASTALLTIETDAHGYAVPGACVLGIEHGRDWRGEPPLDALALLGLSAPSVLDEDARVAVLDAGDERLPLLIRGTLTLIHPAAEELLVLPPALQSLNGLVSHVAVVKGKPSFFVLSPVLLARARRQAPLSLPPPIASR
jgi:hypothetical protein